MKKIQELLRNLDNLRVEIYGTGLIVYNTETTEEENFDTEQEVIEYLQFLS